MFTGIIETLGEIVGIKEIQRNLEFEVFSPITKELHVNQSVSHNGVCLTVTDIKEDKYRVTVIQETIKKSALGKLKIGDFVNLERCMPANGRFDGHIVQGHVDQVGLCESIVQEQGSFLFTFSYNEELGNITVEKGSICLNGISLTVIHSQKSQFTVAIIPYTFQHTNLQQLEVGNYVNLEFDVLGKYLKRILDKY
jgi:riboflavin synthase